MEVGLRGVWWGWIHLGLSNGPVLWYGGSSEPQCCKWHRDTSWCEGILCCMCYWIARLRVEGLHLQPGEKEKSGESASDSKGPADVEMQLELFTWQSGVVSQDSYLWPRKRSFVIRWKKLWIWAELNHELRLLEQSGRRTARKAGMCQVFIGGNLRKIELSPSLFN